MNKYKRHTCKNQPLTVRVEYSRDTFQNGFTWQISFCRESTETDLESNQYIEMVGEELWSMVAEIKNCPYCGEVLSNELKNNGEFVLFNSIGGSVDTL